MEKYTVDKTDSLWPGFNRKLRSFKRSSHHHRWPRADFRIIAINYFSKNYLLWANRILFNSGNKVKFRTYIYQSWICAILLFPSTLFPVHVWSQSWRSNVAFVSFGSISTRCPRGSWDACHVCPHPSLSAIITGWTRLNRLPNREKSQWNTAITLHNFTCHVAFQFRRGSSSLIFQVFIVFFF